MTRYITGLGKASQSEDQSIPAGVFLVKVEPAKYRWHARTPYFSLVFRILQPLDPTGRRFTARLHCTPKTLWKLNWFLGDFGYDPELLERDKADENKLRGLTGVMKVTTTLDREIPVLNLDSFVPQKKWPQFFRHDGSESAQVAS